MSDSSSAALAVAETTEDTPAPAGWSVRTASDADWALEKIGQARRELAELDEQFDAAVQRLEERRATLRKGPENTVAFFTAHLEQWAEPQRAAICDGRRKSRNLLHGRIGWAIRKPLKLVVTDERALLMWARQAGRTLMVESPDMQRLRAEFKSAGSIPPGCDTEGGEDSFYVATEGEE